MRDSTKIQNEVFTVYYRPPYKVLEVNTTKSIYRGMPWRELGTWGKRKFENVIVLKNTEKGKPIKILYV